MSTGYIYPGSKGQFEYEYGGVPKKVASLGNIFLVFVIIMIIILLITLIAVALTRTKTVIQENNELYNLDLLKSLDVATALCCVKPGTTSPDESYIYDTTTGVTFSRDVPNNITTVCNSFPDPPACIAENTDSTGKVKPIATFKAKAYYTFENGLFVGCESTTTCL